MKCKALNGFSKLLSADSMSMLVSMIILKLPHTPKTICECFSTNRQRERLPAINMIIYKPAKDNIHLLPLHLCQQSL